MDAAICGATCMKDAHPVIVFTDPGQDLDDEFALITLRALADEGRLRPVAVVCNLAPALSRARLAKGTLKLLGLGDVPVGVGSDGGCTAHDDRFVASANSYLANEDEVEHDAHSLLRRVLSLEQDASVLF